MHGVRLRVLRGERAGAGGDLAGYAVGGKAFGPTARRRGNTLSGGFPQVPFLVGGPALALFVGKGGPIVSDGSELGSG